MEEAVRVWGGCVGIYGKSLYLPLSFAVNFTLLQKIKSYFKKLFEINFLLEHSQTHTVYGCVPSPVVELNHGRDHMA